MYVTIHTTFNQNQTKYHYILNIHNNNKSNLKCISE